MERLNYQHLYYFWTVTREGSVTRACDKLHLAQPTISGQLAVLEQAVGEPLFHREGRRLRLTDTGRIMFHYAEEIFTLGRDLINTLNGRRGGRGLRLTVGVADALPKLIAYRLIEPALRLSDPVQIVCYEDKAERLLAEMSLQGIDVVLSDVPATPSAGARSFNHLLGECGVAVFGARKLAARYSGDFPRALNGAPMLLPTLSTALRRSLDQWFDRESISPTIQAEIDDSALVKTFGAAGAGLFVAPTAVEKEVQQQYDVHVVGRIEAVRERYYAITAHRKLKHPAVTSILNGARQGLF